jgi:hypothetical protein
VMLQAKTKIPHSVRDDKSEGAASPRELWFVDFGYCVCENPRKRGIGRWKWHKHCGQRLRASAFCNSKRHA